MTGNPEGGYVPPGAAEFRAGRGPMDDFQAFTSGVGPEGRFTQADGDIPVADKVKMRDDVAAIAEQTAEGKQQAKDIETARRTLEQINDKTPNQQGNAGA